jgi:hypothetical protein
VPFQILEQAMSDTLVLALPDFHKPFVVETNASGHGLGAVLMQQGQPLPYLRKTFGERNKHLPIHDKEFLALIMVVDKWRHYLQRNESEIHTDHRALSFLGQQGLHSEL